MTLSKLLGAILVTAFTLPAFAQTATPNINQTGRSQENRIINGLRSGELTVAEARQLQARENGIEAQKQSAKADGVVTPMERRDIRRAQAKTSRAIYRKKHNNRHM